MAEVNCFTENACGRCKIADLSILSEELAPLVSEGIDSSQRIGNDQFHESVMGGETLVKIMESGKELAPGRLWDITDAVNRHVTGLCVGIETIPDMQPSN